MDPAAPDTQTLLDEAMAAHRDGAVEIAAQLYQQVLKQSPEHAQALRLAGALARDQGDAQSARDLLDRACAAAPDDAAPLNELALACFAQGELGPAEIALRAALALDADSVRAWANLGALLQYRGRLHAAADCHREVLQRQPNDLEVRCNLASTLMDAGRGEEALAECEAALSLAAGHPYLLAAKGAVLLGLGQAAAAVECLQQATGKHPEDDMAWTNLGQAYNSQGETTAAVGALRRACEQNPDNARAAADLANLLSVGGDTATALQLCDAFLERHPGERLVLASRAIALRDAGQTEQADDLVDLDRLIQVHQPPTPAGFAEAKEFRAALIEILLNDESLLAEPASKATRGGRQTGELDLSSSPALIALGSLFDEAVQATLVAWRAAGLGNHPVMAYDTGRWTLRAWGTVLDAGGHQAPHQHPLGFVSGVYYLSLPADMQAAGSQAGWLEFGCLPERLASQAPPPARAVQPVPDGLVIFPSYFWHRTLPFTSAESRISIAFDAVPLAG
ncbi:MAG: 2OG-Fe(II) oxygenase family protein [Gammaproteobacteria bacterium]